MQTLTCGGARMREKKRERRLVVLVKRVMSRRPAGGVLRFDFAFEVACERARCLGELPSNALDERRFTVALVVVIVVAVVVVGGATTRRVHIAAAANLRAINSACACARLSLFYKKKCRLLVALVDRTMQQSDRRIIVNIRAAPRVQIGAATNKHLRAAPILIFERRPNRRQSRFWTRRVDERAATTT